MKNVHSYSNEDPMLLQYKLFNSR